MNRNDVAKLAAAIILCELAGVAGSVFTIPSIPTWYASLVKPSFTPPSWLFGPVWTALYLLMGVSLYLVLKRGIGKRGVNPAVTVFGVQLGLNVLWSALFFGLRNPLYGLVGILALWVAIAVTIAESYRVSKAAAYALLPYLAWVTLATVLNFYVFKLN